MTASGNRMLVTDRPSIDAQPAGTRTSGQRKLQSLALRGAADNFLHGGREFRHHACAFNEGGEIAPDLRPDVGPMQSR